MCERPTLAKLTAPGSHTSSKCTPIDGWSQKWPCRGRQEVRFVGFWWTLLQRILVQMSEKVVSGFGCPRRNGVPCLVNQANIEICTRTGQLSFWSDGSLMISSDAERHGIRAIGIKVHAQLQPDPAVKVSA